MGAAAAPDHRVDLVDDHGAYGSQHLAAALGRQQEIQRLRRGDQNVRRRAEHRRALVLRGIAGSDRGRNRRGADAPRLGRPAESAPRLGQVLVDVRAQRFQRRDVDDANGVGKRPGERVFQQIVERDQERGECLARAGRRGDERMTAVANRPPSLALRARRLAERFAEPLSRNRMKRRKRHGTIRVSHIPCTACGGSGSRRSSSTRRSATRQRTASRSRSSTTARSRIAELADARRSAGRCRRQAIGARARGVDAALVKYERQSGQENCRDSEKLQAIAG